MPSNQFRSGDVLCPFFKGRDALTISCETVIDTATLVRNVFPNKASIDFHFGNYCCHKHYKYCEIHQALIEKYEDPAL